MSKPSLVEVVVYDAPAPKTSQGCGCGCGGHDHAPGADGGGHDHCSWDGFSDPLTKVSMELQTQAMAMTLEMAFPGQVRVKYINVYKDAEGSKLDQTELLSSGSYSPPLVYINGKGRFAGGLPVERIREEVAHCLAQGQPH